jgi:hypothetical protein
VEGMEVKAEMFILSVPTASIRCCTSGISVFSKPSEAAMEKEIIVTGGMVTISPFSFPLELRFIRCREMN